MDRIDLTGQRFGRLIALRLSELSRRSRWVVRCDCGAETVVALSNLRNGHTQSCGCLQKERSTAAHMAHGMTGTPEHVIWSGMKARCNDASRPAYGARGISVCDRWTGSDGFANFLADMGHRPSTRHSIERTDNDGNYEPGNCVWAVAKTQANNRRSSIIVELEGERMTVAALSERTGIRYDTLHARIFRLGWSVKDAARARGWAARNRGKEFSPPSRDTSDADDGTAVSHAPEEEWVP